MTETGSENEYRQSRLAHMQKMEELGLKPYGRAFKRSGRVSEVCAGFEEGLKVSLAGRLMTIRDMGKSAFCDLRDGSGRIQVYFKKDVLGDAGYAGVRLLDLGDQVGVSGELFLTRSGEMTVKVEEWTMLAKALNSFPEKWHGLKDVDTRYRQRHLDLIMNPEVRDVFEKRCAVVREVRGYLSGLGFVEVETPMMQPQPGGAAARPFVTHYTALGTDMYLRIAPELYLKRLLVGGFDKVFELNRNFRNEGLSRTHNPEFTMLEVYEAYSDVAGMKDLIQGLIRHVASTVFGTLSVGHADRRIELAGPWREASYRQLVEEKMGGEWYSLPVPEARKRAEGLGLAIDPTWDHLLITHEIYEKLIEKSLLQPTFVTRLPASLVPLAKRCVDDESVVDVFELVINGQEVAPAYSELNDPLEQRRRFSQQAGEDVQKLDEDFLSALEYGMPPAGGMGVGIDRLVMILSGQDAIRDVILFPQLKPKQAEEG